MIENLIEELEDIVSKAWGVPLSGGKCLIDINRLERIVDEIKENLPLDIKRAKDIINKENKIIEGARSASETIVEKAEERAKNIIDEQEIVRLAKKKAKDIIFLAQQREKEIKQSAYEYVESMMTNVEESIKKCLSNIKDIRSTVHAQKKK